MSFLGPIMAIVKIKVYSKINVPNLVDIHTSNIFGVTYRIVLYIMDTCKMANKLWTMYFVINTKIAQ